MFPLAALLQIHEIGFLVFCFGSLTKVGPVLVSVLPDSGSCIMARELL